MSVLPQHKTDAIFRITIPLSEIATATVGPVEINTDATTHAVEKRLLALVDFCAAPRSKKEMMHYLGLTNTKHFRKTYLLPLLSSGKIQMLYPDKPKSPNQKYIKC